MQTKTKEAATAQTGESVQTDAAPAQPQPHPYLSPRNQVYPTVKKNDPL